MIFPNPLIALIQLGKLWHCLVAYKLHAPPGMILMFS